MVGYVLGLGDRHPSNLMLDRKSGKVLHIDFGDCFEVAMQREKFPERVPFRLTRMLVSYIICINLSTYVCIYLSIYLIYLSIYPSIGLNLFLSIYIYEYFYPIYYKACFLEIFYLQLSKFLLNSSGQLIILILVCSILLLPISYFLLSFFLSPVLSYFLTFYLFYFTLFFIFSSLLPVAVTFLFLFASSRLHPPLHFNFNFHLFLLS